MDNEQQINRSNNAQVTEAARTGSLGKATIAALVTAALGALLWITITYFLHWQINYMPIGIGAFVGIFVSKYNQSASIVAGVIAAVTSTLACVLGDFIVTMQNIAENLSITYSQAFEEYGLSEILDAHLHTLDLYSYFFYGTALVIAFILGKSDYKELLKNESKDKTPKEEDQA